LNVSELQRHSDTGFEVEVEAKAEVEVEAKAEVEVEAKAEVEVEEMKKYLWNEAI